MGDDWEEIRRLAADLQRAQLSGTVQKLSERNCIEIVMKLQASGILEVLHTTDGKEYITPQQLAREIKDELYTSGGRIPLGDLAKTLSVDYSHVEAQANVVCHSETGVYCVLGQLVDIRYMDRLSEEVNEVLQQKGTVSISSLTKDYDLPIEFLEDHLTQRIGSIIEGFKDENRELLTPSHVSRQKAKIRGVLSAITVPTGVISIIQKFDFKEKLFFSLADELIRLGRIKGSLAGGKVASKATYIPHAYQRAQNEWVDSFLNTNGYLEYDALSRLGIQDPAGFIKKRFKDIKLLYLPSCCVGSLIVDSVDASVDEVVSSESWLDASTILPSILSEDDIRFILNESITRRAYSAQILHDSVVLSKNFIAKVKSPFAELIKSKAQKDVESGRVASIMKSKISGVKMDMNEELSSKKEDRRKKAAGGKIGGGTQGRETKTKSTKKRKGHAGKKDRMSDSEDDEKEKDDHECILKFMNTSEIDEKICSLDFMRDIPEGVTEGLASLLEPEFDKAYSDLAKEWYQSAISASMQNKRKTLGELTEKINSVLGTIRLFHKGLSIFSDSSVKTQLEKHLNKTLCTDLLNESFLAVAESVGISPIPTSINSPEQRAKLLSSFPAERGEPLLKIHKALGGGSVEEFIAAVEENSEDGIGVLIRSKPDKKKDRQVLFNHRQNLLEQLSAASNEDEALVLHLTVVVSFMIIHSQMLHASGKFVPQIFNAIENNLDQDSRDLLTTYQTNVVELLKEKDPDRRIEIKGFLGELTSAVKKVPTMLKKSASDS